MINMKSVLDLTLEESLVEREMILVQYTTCQLCHTEQMA